MLKLDFSKAYDNVDWRFLLHVLSLHGFNSQWISMIEHCIGTVKASILINGEPAGYFPICRGLRQGDPLSPVLFALVANIFSSMCSKAAAEGWLVGLSCVIEGTQLTHLQYADDTMVFVSPKATPSVLWVRLFRERYDNDGSTSRFLTPSNHMTFLCRSWFVLAQEFNQSFKWQLGNGDQIRFWRDKWCGDFPFCMGFPNLFQLAENKEGTVNAVWREEDGWRIELRRITSEWLVEEDDKLHWEGNTAQS
ncbi:putative ribonuclease H protein [Acorus calamus]|uniref:Ribonuclease H protein n=1 Tax=Acorus calamus TaxID=4465 RepID=A0AAV9EEQ8_ACOCL|nr:putative ribonuclease H protein [Acorus calamus]